MAWLKHASEGDNKQILNRVMLNIQIYFPREVIFTEAGGRGEYHLHEGNKFGYLTNHPI